MKTTSIDLTVQDANIILSGLGKLPYEMSFKTIASFTEQYNAKNQPMVEPEKKEV